jgi:chemotaxis signal transduction protein
VINYRGHLTPIIELSRVLNSASSELLKGPVILVKDKANIIYAISVDAISGSDYYTPDEQDYVNKKLGSQSSKTNYILGVHKGSVAILSIESLLSTIQFD